MELGISRGMLSLLPLLLLLSLLPSSNGVTCDACEGDECREGGCKGDYCVSSLYLPRFGSTPLLEKKEKVSVKGCLNGTMLAENVKSRCYSNGDSEMCICDTDKCTTKKKPKKEITEKIECFCTDSKSCNKGKCTGDLCYWTMDVDGGKATKGCMDLSLPFLERRAIDSCMLPPMSPSMHALALTKDFNEKLLNTESCICSTDNCNGKKPLKTSKKELERMDTQTCSTIVRAFIRGKNYTTKKRTCVGEFCYKMSLRGEGQLTFYEAEGCATFDADRRMDETFGTGECATFKGDRLSAKTCFKTSDREAKRRLEEAVQREESEEEEEGEEEEEIVLVEERPVKGKDERSNGKKDEENEEEEEERKDEEEEKSGKKEEKETKEEERNIGGKEDNPTPTKHFVWVAPTEAPTPDESNATMITVFVLIILCICVAGITWKFQLHRKLMRANYDTVAGG